MVVETVVLKPPNRRELSGMPAGRINSRIHRLADRYPVITLGKEVLQIVSHGAKSNSSKVSADNAS
jgi:hypothetical protein